MCTRKKPDASSSHMMQRLPCFRQNSSICMGTTRCQGTGMVFAQQMATVQPGCGQLRPEPAQRSAHLLQPLRAPIRPPSGVVLYDLAFLRLELFLSLLPVFQYLWGEPAHEHMSHWAALLFSKD